MSSVKKISSPLLRAKARAEVASAWRVIKQHMHVHMSEHARNRIITPPAQCAVLHILRAHPFPTVKAIASFLGITSSATTQLVNNLESEGLLKKEKNPDDNRSILLRTTTTGNRCLVKTDEVFDKEFDTLLAPLSDAELAEYARLTKKLTTSFHEKK